MISIHTLFIFHALENTNLEYYNLDYLMNTIYILFKITLKISDGRL